MAVQQMKMNGSDAAWTVGAGIVAILVAGAFWFGVAYTTVWALRWLISLFVDVGDEPLTFLWVVPIGFSVIEMALHKVPALLPPYVRAIGKQITWFDAGTSIIGIFLFSLLSPGAAPWLAAYWLPTIAGIAGIAAPLGWYLTLRPERIVADALWSIYTTLKPIVTGTK